MASQPQGGFDTRAQYPQTYSEKVISYLGTRNAGVDAAFLLPHLRAGMHLLDCGCGPGTITVGLAATVAPGRTVGIDFEPSQIEQARSLAAKPGLQRIAFLVADAYELPFQSNTYDAVLAHTVLGNIQYPLRALAEMYRVLKPGGVIGIRGHDQGTNIFSPDDPLLSEAHALYFKRWQHLGGDPFGARHSRALLRQVGFVNIGASASTEVWGTPEATRAWGEVFASVIESPTFCEQVITQGWADRATLEQISRALRAWGAHPDAFYARIYCEAIGWKPL
jgi:ubiquinone/menaquinone biosynthesis C-methylase UbiE